MADIEKQDSNKQSATESKADNVTIKENPSATVKGDDNPSPLNSDSEFSQINPTSSPKKKWDLMSCLLVVIILGVIGFTAHSFNLFKLPSFGGQKIAVVDTRLLIMAVSSKVNERLSSGKITLEQSQYEINNQMDKLYEETKNYAADGYTIIPSQYTMFYSDKHDITPDIAEKLGVSYDTGLQELKQLSLTNPNSGIYQKQNAQMQQGNFAPKNLSEGSTFEDHSSLELSAENGQTSDLVLFDNNQ